MTKCAGGGGQGTRYTYAQLEGLWIKAGGPKSRAPIMAAIAMAESGGCSAALNSIGACGLWQIHPRQPGCLDAATNARQAVAKYQGQGLDAWTTYTSGAYKGFLNTSTTADLNVPGKGTEVPSSSASSDAECLVKMPVIGIGPVKTGGGCAVAKSQGRAFLGGGLMAAGAVVGFVGVAILAAYGLKSSGAGRTAGGAMEAVGAGVALVPGAEVAGAGIAMAGSRVRRAGTEGAAARAQDRRARRAVPPKGSEAAAAQQQAAQASSGP